MQSTKKRRVQKTTKRMTLSRRGKKHGGDFSFFKKTTQPTLPIQPIQQKVVTKHAHTGVRVLVCELS